MDVFAGCEPRFFMSIRLDKEQVGQPTQETEEAMKVSHENSVDT